MALDVRAIISTAAQSAGIPVALALAVARTESGLDPNAIGDGGNSLGLFQIQPRWWARWASRYGWDIRTAEGNAMAGAHILASLYQAEGSWEGALRRYNGGPAYEGKPTTATYAAKVLKTARTESRTVWPAKGKIPGAGGKFGAPRPGRKVSSHTGLDISAPTGTPAGAWADGVVIESGFKAGSYGNYIVVRSGEVDHLYAHLSVRSVAKGQRVTAGQMIGRIGDTGYTTGPHLHFEIKVKGRAVDPEPYLTGATTPGEMVDPEDTEAPTIEDAATRFATALHGYMSASGGTPASIDDIKLATLRMVGRAPAEEQQPLEGAEEEHLEHPPAAAVESSPEDDLPYQPAETFRSLGAGLSAFTGMMEREMTRG